MSRRPRQPSRSGIYHIMLRGIDRQVIFQDEEDRDKFLLVLQDCKEVSLFRLYAYCLMDNHIHLLLQTNPKGESLSQIFKRIGVRYVAWYNRKYGRTGHLFQDRFLSEPIHDDSYLFTVLPYIHQNPVKAGICENPGKYPWSSWQEYLRSSKLCDTQDLLALLSDDPKTAIETLRKLHKKPIETPCLEMEQPRPSDKEVRTLLLELCGTNQISNLQGLSVQERDRIILALKARKASLRQISRLTGWPFGIVRK